MKVKFEVEIAHEGALLFETVALCIRALENVEDTSEVTVDFNPKKPFHTGHVSGCRQVNARGAVVRGEVCTCGPVPR